MFSLATAFLKKSRWSIKPYCADIVSGLFEINPEFFLVILLVISESLIFFHSPSNSGNLKLGALETGVP